MKANTETKSAQPGFVVLKQEPSGLWRMLGEVERHPGLSARAARTQAIVQIVGDAPKKEDNFAVVPKSEWRVALDNEPA